MSIFPKGDSVIIREVWSDNLEREFELIRDIVDDFPYIAMDTEFPGNLPTCGTDKHCVWQFNFCEFNPNEDVYANDSIELLSQSGIDFIKNFEMVLMLIAAYLQESTGHSVEFFKLIKLYFPVLYDIKHLMKFCNSLHGGLNKLAELLEWRGLAFVTRRVQIVCLLLVHS
ncbi:hypothetical protein GH714_011347 [Hevea brasiliensis]|uniref:Uncharacterized protein n=1 Tax=Hevea brasiliensis TaxID=3981 RepID=A0A6A6MX92_HEVBR|nr:hypothetical protein GH714_011347 [Hevea brasiliensis]